MLKYLVLTLSILLVTTASGHAQQENMPPPRFPKTELPPLDRFKIVIGQPINRVNRKDEPLVPEWVSKDIEGVKWIKDLLPLERQTLSSLKRGLRVTTASENEDFGFGSRRVYIRHGNGYTSFYVDAFFVHGKIGYYKVGISGSTTAWSRIKTDLLKTWVESGGPPVTEEEEGFYFTKSDEQVLTRYKRSVEAYLGKLRPVQMSAELKPLYDYLISPLEKSRVGPGICGLPAPGTAGVLLEGREAIDAMVETGRIDLLTNVLRGFNPGGRVYAAIELLRLKRKGHRLPRETRVGIQRVLNLKTELATCHGCIVFSGLTGRQIVNQVLKEDQE